MINLCTADVYNELVPDSPVHKTYTGAISRLNIAAARTQH